MKAFKCPSCSTTTWGNLKFCPKCGESLDIICDGCGYTLRYMMAAEVNFCPKCGGKMKGKNKSNQKEKNK
jgi:rRNA maturation endonuclease Nob1